MIDGINDMAIQQEKLRKLLTIGMEYGAQYQVKYPDYEINVWTVPLELTEKRIEELIKDFSVEKVRLVFNT